MTGGLVAMFASYSVTRYLAEAARGVLDPGVVAQIIGLRVLVALEVLVPLGLYLGVIVGLGRLYGDNEIVAMQAGGLTRSQMLRPLLAFAILVGVLVGGLSMALRPWAYGQLYTLENNAQSRLEISDLVPGQFYADEDDDMVVYATHVDDQANRAEDVFASTHDDGRRVVIRAASMTRDHQAGQPPMLIFHHGHLYAVDPGGDSDRTLDFDNLNWRLQPSDEVVGYKRKAASTAKLWHSHDPDDVAERQWRFSRPVATVFLALLGLVFARSAPRRGRAANVFAAAVCFALYYNLAGIARNWVEQASVPALPGIYWVDGLVALLLAVLWWGPRRTAY